MAVIYLTEQGSVLKKVGRRIVVTKNETKLLDIPAIKVKQIVIFGNCQLTTQATSFCLKEGIDVLYLSQSGRFKGRLQSDYSMDVSVRQAQFLYARRESFCLAIGEKIVMGKIYNSIQLCKTQRSFFSSRKIKSGIKRLETYKTSIDNGARSLDQLRGIEGRSSVVYFEIYRELLKQDMGFKKRIKHPPTDPLNILLSLGYTLLYNNVFAMIHLAGMDPYQGFYHRERHGHASLASDLMEEFRSPIVDRAVLRLINKRSITKRDFEKRDKGIRLSPDAFKRFVTAYNEAIETKVSHRVAGKRLTLLQSIEFQARYLSKVLKKKEKEYQFFEVD